MEVVLDDKGVFTRSGEVLLYLDGNAVHHANARRLDNCLLIDPAKYLSKPGSRQDQASCCGYKRTVQYHGVLLVGTTTSCRD